MLLGVEEDWENLTDYDFMFQLTDEVFINMRSQIVTSSWGLFNPPGVGPFDKDPDDDIPFHGFDEDPEE